MNIYISVVWTLFLVGNFLTLRDGETTVVNAVVANIIFAPVFLKGLGVI